MKQGLQIWDENSNSVLDTNEDTIKILRAYSGVTNETFTHPLIETEIPFYFVLPKKRYGHDFVSVSFSGSSCTVINNQSSNESVNYVVYIGVR